MKIYLAGGMHTEWRERVKREVQGPKYLDPTTHGLDDPKAYTAWDIEAIKQSDLVVAYFEMSNPVGFNMAYEMGYASCANIEVLFINERFADNPRPVSMLCERSHTVATLDVAIEWLHARVAAVAGAGWSDPFGDRFRTPY